LQCINSEGEGDDCGGDGGHRGHHRVGSTVIDGLIFSEANGDKGDVSLLSGFHGTSLDLWEDGRDLSLDVIGKIDTIIFEQLEEVLFGDVIKGGDTVVGHGTIHHGVDSVEDVLLRDVVEALEAHLGEVHTLFSGLCVHHGPEFSVSESSAVGESHACKVELPLFDEDFAEILLGEVVHGGDSVFSSHLLGLCLPCGDLFGGDSDAIGGEDLDCLIDLRRSQDVEGVGHGGFVPGRGHEGGVEAISSCDVVSEVQVVEVAKHSHGISRDIHHAVETSDHGGDVDIIVERQRVGARHEALEGITVPRWITECESFFGDFQNPTEARILGDRLDSCFGQGEVGSEVEILVLILLIIHDDVEIKSDVFDSSTLDREKAVPAVTFLIKHVPLLIRQSFHFTFNRASIFAATKEYVPQLGADSNSFPRSVGIGGLSEDSSSEEYGSSKRFHHLEFDLVFYFYL